MSDGHAELAVDRRGSRSKHLRRRRLVELAGRLVGEQHPPAVRQRRRRAPPAAARRRTSRPGRRSPQCPTPEQLQQLGGPAARSRPPVGARRAQGQSPRSRRAVRYGSRLRDGLLPHEPDHAPLVGHALAPPHRDQVVPGDPDDARRRGVEPGEDVEQRRLARARGADEGDQLAAVDQVRLSPWSACTSTPCAVKMRTSSERRMLSGGSTGARRDRGGIGGDGHDVILPRRWCGGVRAAFVRRAKR